MKAILINVLLLTLSAFTYINGQGQTFGFEEEETWLTNDSSLWKITDKESYRGSKSLRYSVNKNTVPDSFKTVCNPIDLSYRFQGGSISRREAADPTVVLFKDTYFMFASKSGGYWHSKDLSDWVFIATGDIPTEDYAPTAIVMRDTVFFMASSKQPNKIYKSADPLTGKWQVAKDAVATDMWDPAFFLDDDGRLFIYWGCSNREPIWGVELDPVSFDFIGSKKGMLEQDRARYGWEVRGDYNQIYEDAPWIEGAWLNKYNGKYYLQYAGPGTQFKSYNDGVYLADSPLGPYTLAKHNPFAYKPEGYACGAGHGSTFYDKYGNIWHVGTITVSIKHHFERRLAIYPSFLDDENVLYAPTAYGDFPTIIPQKKIENVEQTLPGWMLLSYNKPVTVSSTLDTFRSTNMVDEEIRSYWAATTGNDKEWAIVDLEEVYPIKAIQVNFAEHNTTLIWRPSGIKHSYIIEGSTDKTTWNIIIDESASTTDNTHNYHQLTKNTRARYIRVKNIEVPDGCFALSGLRIFGLGDGSKPDKISNLIANRNSGNRRSVRLSWDNISNATGYVIRYGSEPDKLYHSYMVFGTNSVTINSLSTEEAYTYTIEAFNENGITLNDIKTTTD